MLELGNSPGEKKKNLQKRRGNSIRSEMLPSLLKGRMRNPRKSVAGVFADGEVGRQGTTEIGK